MSRTATRIAHIATAERPGSRGTSQDRIYQTPNAVIVLDGASEPDQARYDGAWIAEQLGTALRDRLTAAPDQDLGGLLHEAIATTAAAYDLTPRRSPSTTVTIARWNSDQLDVFVLGDTPAVITTTDLRQHIVRDDRLAEVAHEQRRAYVQQVSAEGLDGEHRYLWRALVDEQRAHRNQPDGYWIAEADPAAAHHAHHQRWPLDQVVSVLLVTDGVSNGVDRYQHPATWHDAVRLAHTDPRRLVDTVHQAEETDPQARRWPRLKRHDDKAAALIRFTTPEPSPLPN